MTARQVATVAALLAGCAQFRPPAAGGGEAAAAGGDESCAAGALVEDGEDGDDRVRTVAGRGGYLYTYADEQGTTIAPKGEVTPVAGGAAGSARALRFQGQLGTGSDSYAGLGLAFTEPKGAYDASRWRGIAFRARRGPGGPATLRVKLPDGNTDPGGGACTSACYNDFGATLELDEQWTRYEVAFADLKQEDGWGEPRPAAIDASRLFGVQWQVSTPGAAFDVWIDDVTFLGCEPPQ